ncbi:hypothetical protein Nepgr_018993 [Nepenthes gracilis]|uniref:Transmembrane protein n=1 Tax=Nepenthes gracilis TaxID=150966 RepID=A0AAD3SU72_NEPGR|nr:hypothetical protein Nepgr_018993 [Nepenthes gracilis]
MTTISVVKYYSIRNSRGRGKTIKGVMVMTVVVLTSNPIVVDGNVMLALLLVVVRGGIDKSELSMRLVVVRMVGKKRRRRDKMEGMRIN